MILFLDFDGVLHPWSAPRSELFCFLPRLEVLLREFPEVQIVICSDWRFTETLEQLRAVFSADIAGRVIGQTPSLDDGTVGQIGLRRREALAYLEHREAPDVPWCVLDDRKSLWEPLDSRIIICPDRFGDSEEKLLRDLLKNQLA